MVDPVLVAANVGLTPEIGLLLASNKVIVTTDEATPSAATGPVPVMVLVVAEGAPGKKVTELPVLTNGVAMERVFDSALVDLRLQVEIPELFVMEHVPIVLPVPDELKVGVIPVTPLLSASFRVIVTRDCETPLAMAGVVPVIYEFAPLTAPEIKFMFTPGEAAGERTERVLV